MGAYPIILIGETDVARHFLLRLLFFEQGQLQLCVAGFFVICDRNKSMTEAATVRRTGSLRSFRLLHSEWVMILSCSSTGWRRAGILDREPYDRDCECVRL